jgi:hypothetical protein
MKTHVAIYDTHEKALLAIKLLNEMHFPMDHVSLIGKADIIDDHIHFRSVENLKLMSMIGFIVLGILVGLLSGLEYFKIPGVVEVNDSSLFINSFIGFDIGLIAGGLSTIIIALLIKKDKMVKFKEKLIGKRFLVIVNGTIQEVEIAEHILHTEGAHLKSVA